MLLEQVDPRDVCAYTNKGLANVVLQLTHTPTKNEAKELRRQLRQDAINQLAPLIDQYGDEKVMRALGGYGAAWEPSIGQRTALKLMPDAITSHFLTQSHTKEVQLIGMQYYEQTWEEKVPLTVRVSAIDLNGEYRSCAQIAQRVNAGTNTEIIEWKTIGLIAEDTYAPPIGLMGVGLLEAELKQVIIHSPELVAIGFDKGLCDYEAVGVSMQRWRFSFPISYYFWARSNAHLI